MSTPVSQASGSSATSASASSSCRRTSCPSLTDRVEALGGSLRVDSRQGNGTQITAELPRELEAPQPAG